MKIDDKSKIKTIKSKWVDPNLRFEGQIEVSEGERKRQRVIQKIEELNDKFRQDIVMHENFGTRVSATNLSNLYSINGGEEEESDEGQMEIEGEDQVTWSHHANTIIFWFRAYLRRKEKR